MSHYAQKEDALPATETVLFESSDGGNKRTAAALSLYFLDRNGMLFDAAGEKPLADEVLVALTIMLAESRPDEKEAMARLTMNFLCG